MINKKKEKIWHIIGELRAAVAYFEDELNQLEAIEMNNNNKRVFTVKRISNIPDGIFGVILDGNIPFALTVENNDYVIPVGKYLCKRTIYHKHNYETFEITGVPDRTRILIHKGVIEDHSEGCVIVGESFEPPWKGKIAVFSSSKAFNELMDRTKGLNSFKLIIKEHFD